MAVWTLGLNHTTAPLDVRGRFAFAVDQLVPTLQRLRQDLSPALPQPPEVASKSYLLLDMTTDKVLAERNADAPSDPASLHPPIRRS